MTATLHYIYDPLCGWCYGAEPLAQAAADVDDLEVALHGGGLWPEPTQLPDHMRNYISEADKRLAELSGQPMGERYKNELLFDPELILESAPTIRAVLAAESLGRKGLAMLQAIQHAHYVDGRHVVRPEVLADLAGSIGLDSGAFKQAVDNVDVEQHIAQTRALMGQIGAQGFPTFVLELNGQWYGVEHNRFQRNAAGFAEWLKSAVDSEDAAAQSG